MMDTNSLAILVAALAQKSATPNANLILLLAALGPLLAAIAAWFAKSASSNTVKAAESVEKIHVAVNSERTSALNEIKALKDEILKLSEKIARTEGKSEQDAQAILAGAVIAASKKIQDGSNQPNSE